MPTLEKQTISSIAKKTSLLSERNLFPILDPESFLETSKRRKILADIRLLLDTTDEHFDALYKQLILNFISFVQVIPSSNTGRLGSLMDEGLLRGLFALQAQNQEKAENIDPLISYVLFSAALLFDVGFVTENRLITISSKEGDFIKQWQPYKGAMKLSDGYYKIRFGDGMPSWLCRRITALFAREVMPSLGFQWIAQDPYALNAWLTLLGNEQEGVEDLKMFLERANRLLDEIRLTSDFVIPTDINIETPTETSLGEDFYEWLKKGLEDGTITINTKDSKVHVIENGLFLEPEIFKDFSKTQTTHPNWEHVLKQLARLGFIKQRGMNAIFDRYYYVPDEITRDPTRRTENIVYVVGENIAKYGIREGITVLMPYALMIFTRRFLPYLNKNLRLAMSIKEREKSSKYPELPQIAGEIKEVVQKDLAAKGK